MALDPAYAPALGRLAEVEVEWYVGYDPDQHRLKRAEDLLERAMRIDPRLGVVRHAHGLLLEHRFDYQRAAAEFEQLVRDEPLNSEAWLDVCKCHQYVWPRRLPEAERACRRALEINPTYDSVYYFLARVLVGQVRRAEANQALQELSRRADLRGEDEPADMVGEGRFWIALETGRPQEALAALAIHPQEGLYGLVRQSAALSLDGQIDEAFNRLEQALEKGFRDGPQLRYAPWYEPLRKDPRFEKLLAKYGLGQ